MWLVYYWIDRGLITAQRKKPGLPYAITLTYETIKSAGLGYQISPPCLTIPKPKLNKVDYAAHIPTVADRIAQEVARRYLEPRLEPVFHPTPMATTRPLCHRCRAHGTPALLVG